MKIKTISRSEEGATRSTAREVVKVHKNPDPKLHPFERAREYTRALRAVKMDRMFAKPFLGALDDHSDGVYCGATSPASLTAYVSGAADGEVIVWDLAAQAKLWSVYAHASFVRGVSVARDGASFWSVGDDRTIKQWRMAAQEALADGAGAGGEEDDADDGGAGALGRRKRGVAPLRVWHAKYGFTGVDAHWRDLGRFATSGGSVVELWDAARGEATHSYEWGADTVTSVRWNPAEADVFASTSNDRGVVLYDARQSVPLRKAVLALRSNALAWNPREPMNFTVANEDHNLYSFDMRKLDAGATCVHKDHAGAVMDVHYAPTGKEFVSASYDKTVRIWRVAGSGVGAGRSREVYHTSRMQRVFSVRFTPDARFIVSGSDDANVRIWKARASEQLGRQLPRERAAADYRQALKKKFGHLPEIRRIATFRRLPGGIKSAATRAHDEAQRERKKLANIRAHSKRGSGAGVPEKERKKMLVAVQK